jgi:hypothetical protein
MGGHLIFHQGEASSYPRKEWRKASRGVDRRLHRKGANRDLQGCRNIRREAVVMGGHLIFHQGEASSYPIKEGRKATRGVERGLSSI